VRLEHQTPLNYIVDGCFLLGATLSYADKVIEQVRRDYCSEALPRCGSQSRLERGRVELQFFMR
jgi:hypothetical protein